MNKLKLFGNYLRDLVLITYKIIRNRRTWIAVCIITFLYVYAYFWRNYYIQSPIKSIKWQCIVCKADTKPEIATVSAQVVQPLPTVMALKPVKTEKDIVMEQKHGEQLWKIYFLESTHGEKDGCRKEGKFGGFGVMSSGEVVCYDTFEKAVERAEYWWAKLNPDEDLDGALCQWNTGKRQPMCTYSMTYHSF